MKLVFKNKGQFADEGSARYEAIVNNDFIIRVFNDPYIFKGFIFHFLDMNGYPLGKINGNFLSNFWNNATKKEVISYVTGIINDIECYNLIKESALKN